MLNKCLLSSRWWCKWWRWIDLSRRVVSPLFTSGRNSPNYGDLSDNHNALIRPNEMNSNSLVSSDTQSIMRFSWLSQNSLFLVGVCQSGWRQSPHITLVVLALKSFKSQSPLPLLLRHPPIPINMLKNILLMTWKNNHGVLSGRTWNNKVEDS